jgi:hypothetical protein
MILLSVNCVLRIDEAISSLPYYFMYASSILVLCENWELLDNKSTGYLSRGHCLMELITAKLPRQDVFGRWYIPGFHPNGEWGRCTALDITAKTSKILDWTTVMEAGCPLDGKFTVPEDGLLMGPLLVNYVAAFEAFDRQFLEKLRNSRSWSEVKNFGEQNLPQLGDIDFHKTFSTPTQFADYLLPPGYVARLRAGVEAAGYACSPEKQGGYSDRKLWVKLGESPVASPRQSPQQLIFPIKLLSPSTEISKTDGSIMVMYLLRELLSRVELQSTIAQCELTVEVGYPIVHCTTHYCHVICL